MLMVEDFILVEKQRRIEIGLAGSPEALPPKTSKVIRIVVREEYMLAEEVIGLEFLLLREGILWLGLRGIGQLHHHLRNRNLRIQRLMNVRFFFSSSLGLQFFININISTSGWNFFRNGRSGVRLFRAHLNFSVHSGLRNLLQWREHGRVGVMTFPKVIIHH